MTSSEIRQQFLDFFASKGHVIVPSAPIVVKNDPTLMFTNAGMNQFKDYFLGNKPVVNKRVADTQKCLRVSGKHNDLEEVGVDTYHHTMFEMLGNWSFGDYFKKEAIEWSWELLTKVYGLDKDRLYVTIFEGDEKEGLPRDEEAYNEWKKWLPEDRILMGNKKDNFWEMGDTGPCGPCTEIHFDSRPNANNDGHSLVNNDETGTVMEIWNNVFIQFNRSKNGTLEPLPDKHVDTGMGLERLVKVIQGKISNYDTDVFTGTIAEISRKVNKVYKAEDDMESIAFRVLSDHIRAISFTIADGQLPSNTGAGYVIRRILRRAVRYYFTYLDYKQPLLYQLLPSLAKQFENVFPELQKQVDFVINVVKEEEEAFLRTLAKGIEALEEYYDAYVNEYHEKPLGEYEKFRNEIINQTIAGEFAFKLLDTYGFPIDLTNLIAKERSWKVNIKDFEKEMQKQKQRSRAATAVDSEDWVVLSNKGDVVSFVSLSDDSGKEIPSQLSNVYIIKYRKVKQKESEYYQIVLSATDFYAEGGGQVGDTGILLYGNNDVIEIFDTKKENDTVIHFAKKIPAILDGNIPIKTRYDIGRRKKIAVHHSATHLVHAALRKVLGTHVAQKGSLVNEEHLRFDFSHFVKVTDEEIATIETLVNKKIRENIPVVIKEMPKEEAMKLGAMALFGEKYGDVVRVVIIDPTYSVELCGGTHVGSTGELGLFKITHETAVGASVRRIEAVCGVAAERFINNQLGLLNRVKELIKNPKDVLKGLEKLIEAKNEIEKRLESIEMSKSSALIDVILKNGVKKHNDFSIVSYSFECYSEEIFLRVFNTVRARVKNSVIILGARIGAYEKLLIFLNSKDNNYAMNTNPMQFYEYVSGEISNLIILQSGDLILNASGIFKKGVAEVVSNLTDYLENVYRVVDGLFPPEE